MSIISDHVAVPMCTSTLLNTKSVLAIICNTHSSIKASLSGFDVTQHPVLVPQLGHGATLLVDSFTWFCGCGVKLANHTIAVSSNPERKVMFLPLLCVVYYC